MFASIQAQPGAERAVAERHLIWSPAAVAGGRAAFDRATGVVYVPAAAAGEEFGVLLAAAVAGTVTIVAAGGHAYLPSTWLARYFPEAATACAVAERAFDQEW